MDNNKGNDGAKAIASSTATKPISREMIGAEEMAGKTDRKRFSLNRAFNEMALALFQRNKVLGEVFKEAVSSDVKFVKENQYSLLMAIAQHENGVSQKSLKEDYPTLKDYGNISYALNKLEELGLITKKMLGNDKRIVLNVPTEAGFEVARKIGIVRDLYDKNIVDKIKGDPEDLAAALHEINFQ